MDNLKEHFIKPLDEYITSARKICDHIGYDQIAYTLIRLINNSKCEAKCFTSVEQLANMYEYAHRNTERDVYQAMEATVHNLCTLASRAGAQVPFSSLNLGTCTSLEGRMVTRNLLLAVEAGLGYGETAIFPISIFKLKKGVNRAPGDPNYDLKKLALRVTAKRLFPNFLNLDAPYNLKYYKVGRPETEVTAMGCVHGREVSLWQLRNKHGITFYEGMESFDNMADYLTNKGCIWHKFGNITRFINMEDELVELFVYDTNASNFVKVKKFIKNKHNGYNEGLRTWREIHFSDGTIIRVTSDHPLPVVGKGRTEVANISVGDKIPVSKMTQYTMHLAKCIKPETFTMDDKYKVVDSINDISDWCKDDSFDVETVSDRFDFSGIQSHNCRTRTISNIHDPSKEQVTGRGNLFFTTINLPYLALEVKQEAKDGDDIVSLFFNKLEERLNDVVNLSMDRFNLIAKRKAKNYPFLMGQHLYVGSDDLHPDDSIGEVIKHGSMTAGFIGLAETLVVLTGKHHGESAEAQALGLKIVKYMNDFMTEVSEKTKLNFGVMGSPAEGCSGRLLRLTRKKFGTIEGVTDKDYLTNSFHVPVAMQLSAWDKIQIEAPYHQYCPAGHISYLELDADAVSNLDALETIVDTMCDNNMGYFAINHPVDRDPVCGYVGYFPDGVCPRCGRREGEGVPVSKLLSLRSYSPDPQYDARRESSAPTATLNLVE